MNEPRRHICRGDLPQLFMCQSDNRPFETDQGIPYADALRLRRSGELGRTVSCLDCLAALREATETGH